MLDKILGVKDADRTKMKRTTDFISVPTEQSYHRDKNISYPKYCSWMHDGKTLIYSTISASCSCLFVERRTWSQISPVGMKDDGFLHETFVTFN